MITIQTPNNLIELTQEEWECTQQLLRIALEFEKDSFELFKELAIHNEDLEDVKAAMDEIIQDEKEKELIIKINQNENLINKIKMLLQ